MLRRMISKGITDDAGGVNIQNDVFEQKREFGLWHMSREMGLREVCLRAGRECRQSDPGECALRMSNVL